MATKSALVAQQRLAQTMLEAERCLQRFAAIFYGVFIVYSDRCCKSNDVYLFFRRI